MSEATSIFARSASLSSTVTSSTTAVATTTGANLSVERAGRTDTYSNISVTGNSTLTNGNVISSYKRVVDGDVASCARCPDAVRRVSDFDRVRCG